MTQFPEIKDPTIQLLCDRILGATKNQNTGTLYTVFQDRLGNAVPANSQLSGNNTNTASQAGPGREVEIVLRVQPDGLGMTARIIAQSPAGLQSITGVIDSPTLATHLS